MFDNNDDDDNWDRGVTPATEFDATAIAVVARAAPLVNTGYDGGNNVNNNTATVEEVRHASSLLNKPNLSQLTLDPTVEGAFITEDEGQQLMNTPHILTPSPQEECVVSTTVTSTPILVETSDQLKQVGDRDTSVDDRYSVGEALDLESLLEGPTILSLPFTQETMDDDGEVVEEQNDLLPPDDSTASLPIHTKVSFKSNPIPVVNLPEHSVESDTVQSFDIDEKGATSDDHHNTTDIPSDTIVKTSTAPSNVLTQMS